MEKLQESQLECEDLKIPVFGFISFLKSATNRELGDDMIASINKNYEKLEYEQFLDKFFDTFGSHIPGYADEYKDLFIEYISEKSHKKDIENTDVFGDIADKILSIIDGKNASLDKRISDEENQNMIRFIDELIPSYSAIDENHIRIAELESMKNLLSKRIKLTKNIYFSFEKNLEMFQSEIEK